VTFRDRGREFAAEEEKIGSEAVEFAVRIVDPIDIVSRPIDG
jgi:hypothetical protein